MKKLNLILPVMTLLTMIFGCGGESDLTPKGWKKAKPLSEKLDHPNALANDGKFIYFVTGGTVASWKEGTNNVMKMPVEGGAPTILFKGGELIPDANSIALDETHVYFSANGLRRVPKNGGETQRLTEVANAWEIVADNENVYWLPYVGERMPPAPIYSVSKNGGTPKALTDPRPSANGLCADDKFVYWTQTDGIYKISKQGGNIEKVYAIPNDSEIISGLQIDGENFYFRQVQSSRLMKIPKSGGGEAKLIAKDIGKFRVGEDEVIFEQRINSLNYAIFRADKNGESVKELDAGGFLSDLTIGKTKIYLSNSGKIFELEK